MAITDESRYELHQRLEAVLGSKEAATLMEHLPPVGWADVATKRDLDGMAASIRADFRHELAQLAGGLRAEIGGLRAEIGGLRGEFYREQRNLIFAMLAANSTLAALAFAAARLV